MRDARAGFVALVKSPFEYANLFYDNRRFWIKQKQNLSTRRRNDKMLCLQYSSFIGRTDWTATNTYVLRKYIFT